MTIRSTPERVWSEIQADFKGPVRGRYYFHVVTDQLSRWPEMEIVSRTSFDKLKPALERREELGTAGNPRQGATMASMQQKISEWSQVMIKLMPVWM